VTSPDVPELGVPLEEILATPDRPEEFVPTLSPAELQLASRRELARRTTDAISEVLEVDVTVPMLLALAADSEDESVRLPAKRALRCVEAISRENSTLLRAIGETGLYDYVEGVIEYGASERKYVALLEGLQLDAQSVTGLYALREAIREETDGGNLGFDVILNALEEVGIGPREAAEDVEGSVRVLSEAGYFMDHLGTRTYSRPIFAPHLAGVVELGRNVDSFDTSYGSLPDPNFRLPFADESPEESE